MKNTVSFSKNSTNVFFHILTNCNLKCRHCYINKKEHGRSSLSISTINKWLKYFAGITKEANVIFLGGEPTLHKDLPNAIKTANNLNYKSITVDTNGYLFNDFFSHVHPSDISFMSFSLDGATRETNDLIRGEGCYDTCIRGIRASVEKGYNTSLIYTVSRMNIHELEMMIPFIKELGINRFFIQVIGIRGNSRESTIDNLQITRNEWDDLIPKVAEKISKNGIPVIFPKVFLDQDETFECAGLVANNYFIFPNGRVYRCPLCEDFPLHSLEFKNNRLMPTSKINETDLFNLTIPEGCVMNKLIQPDNLTFKDEHTPEYKIACCLLKETMTP